MRIPRTKTYLENLYKSSRNPRFKFNSEPFFIKSEGGEFWKFIPTKIEGIPNDATIIIDVSEFIPFSYKRKAFFRKLSSLLPNFVIVNVNKFKEYLKERKVQKFQKQIKRMSSMELQGKTYSMS